MKLYVCYGTFTAFGHKHPCTEAHKALVEAGYNPTVERVYGWGKLPMALNPKRKAVLKLTGDSYTVPALEGDNGELLGKTTREIIDWARANPATTEA